jgi:hypothetical protein
MIFFVNFYAVRPTENPGILFFCVDFVGIVPYNIIST